MHTLPPPLSTSFLHRAVHEWVSPRTALWMTMCTIGGRKTVAECCCGTKHSGTRNLTRAPGGKGTDESPGTNPKEPGRPDNGEPARPGRLGRGRGGGPSSHRGRFTRGWSETEMPGCRPRDPFAGTGAPHSPWTSSPREGADGAPDTDDADSRAGNARGAPVAGSAGHGGADDRAPARTVLRRTLPREGLAPRIARSTRMTRLRPSDPAESSTQVRRSTPDHLAQVRRSTRPSPVRRATEREAAPPALILPEGPSSFVGCRRSP
jgi:hypothetical protein